MPKVTHAEPHAAALKTLGVSDEHIARAAALGLNWGTLLSTLIPVVLPVVLTWLEGLGKTPTAPPA